MAVVAQSLASLTNLAANPPLYPHNPTERPSDPLTLYIVKVPGSRDVFLTPLKPRDKVVSANDVQSSLYFLHVDTDAAYEHEIRLQQQRSRANSATHGTVVRKPLPTPPTSPDTEYPSDFRIPSPLPHRKPLPASASLSAPQHSYGDRTSFDTSAPIDLGGLSLTLIRRDPSSGAQWNVAKIWDPPVPDISSDSYNDTNQTFSRAQATGTPLYLELENPGYVRFNQMEGSRPLSRDSRSNPSLDPNAALTDGRFRRRLYMEGSRYTDHTYTHRKASSDISVFDMYRPPLQQQRLSTQSIPRPSVDRRSKGYAFMSPWGGKCSFSTGASGRSLKCKHHVNHTVSQEESVAAVSELRFNLPSARSANIDLDPAVANGRASSYFSNAKGHRYSLSDPTTRTRSRSGSLTSELDLSLGQERAGGGFGGKRAKLGKLIIEDEGQKMLDLVVAANMALWWRAYERL